MKYNVHSTHACLKCVNERYIFRCFLPIFSSTQVATTSCCPAHCNNMTGERYSGKRFDKIFQCLDRVEASFLMADPMKHYSRFPMQLRTPLMIAREELLPLLHHITVRYSHRPVFFFFEPVPLSFSNKREILAGEPSPFL